MSNIPSDPEQFFREHLPRTFASLKPQLAGTSSPGAVVFRVGARTPYAVRLDRGDLQVSEGVPADTVVQLSVSDGDFEPVLVRGAALLAGEANGDRQLAVLRALTLESERVAAIRAVRGSVAFVLTGEAGEHRVTLTPGSAEPNVQTPDCSVRCALSDFLAMQRGAANPFELMMNGKIQISGDAQIPMALSSLLM